MTDDRMNDNSMVDTSMNDNSMADHTLSMADEREALYQALSTIEDSLVDGYHSHRPLPDFALDKTHKTTSARKIQTMDHAGIAAIASELMRCRACRLAVTRKQVVPGTGPAGSALFILGEYPSDEATPGLPFSQDAGLLMAKMLSAIGLDRNRDCFETTTVKCRPPMDRDPAPDELSSCLPFLERQILAIQPKAILAFGRISAQILLGSRDALPSFRGTVHAWRGIPLVATYHPEAILKDDSLKRPAWEDLKLLKAIIGNA